MKLDIMHGRWHEMQLDYLKMCDDMGYTSSIAHRYLNMPTRQLVSTAVYDNDIVLLAFIDRLTNTVIIVRRLVPQEEKQILVDFEFCDSFYNTPADYLEENTEELWGRYFKAQACWRDEWKDFEIEHYF